MLIFEHGTEMRPRNERERALVNDPRVGVPRQGSRLPARKNGLALLGVSTPIAAFVPAAVSANSEPLAANLAMPARETTSGGGLFQQRNRA